MLKKGILAITAFYNVALAIVCLINIKELPEVAVSNIDKIFHFVTYALLMCLWYFSLVYTLNFSQKKGLWYAFLIAFVFGIVIEVLQGTITTTRALDVFDVVANTLGALLATLVLSIYNMLQVKNK
ncbi:VanZ family protein [Tamlana sp. 62-3]|uniref:VanZ family protein n=1 Tax=Neotamlana sargassicola TaxID=2883125 RepID=A0A9X1I5I9_9FLAO|nr:VanZ family protein [Tamlana sargassicola]MCB4806799.1 VanZ family protein [Tamlana sargassicola]